MTTKLTKSQAKYQPRHVYIVCGKVNEWLYPPMMDIMRARFGTRFSLLTAGDRVEELKAKCGPDDKVVSIAEKSVAPIGSRTQSPEQVYARAREYEAKYRLTYMRDLVQQDRSLSTYFLENAPNSSFREAPPAMVDIVDYINRCFEHYEKFLSDEGIDLLINRPAGLEDIVMSEVALAMGIPVSFFHGSYYGGGAQWAAGPYMGDLVLHKIYDDVPAQDPPSIEELKPSATWVKPTPPGWRELIVKLIKNFVIYAEFWIQDLKQMKLSRRVPIQASIASILSEFDVQRFLDRISESDLEEITALPFVYIALPHEPEYTVQSLCREFADTTAWFRQVALSLPAGYRMVVKEHQRIGHRKKEYYESFLKFPNVVVAHAGIRGVDLIARCAATVTMGGSTPAEAGLFGKPSIVLGTRNPYSFLPHVSVVKNPRNLPEVLRNALKARSQEETEAFRSAAARFRAAVHRVSFDASGTRLFRGSMGENIDPGEVEKAVETLLISAAMQKQQALKSSQKQT